MTLYDRIDDLDPQAVPMPFVSLRIPNMSTDGMDWERAVFRAGYVFGVQDALAIVAQEES
jgi:hypothetical protein